MDEINMIFEISKSENPIKEIVPEPEIKATNPL